GASIHRGVSTGESRACPTRSRGPHDTGAAVATRRTRATRYQHFDSCECAGGTRATAVLGPRVVSARAIPGSARRVCPRRDPGADRGTVVEPHLARRPVPRAAARVSRRLLDLE